MPTTIAYENASGATVEIVFDAVDRTTHDLTSTPTQHPVESAENVSDHVFPEPDRCTLEAFVSQQPVGIVPDPEGNPQGQRTTKEIALPRYEPPLQPTPGSVFGAASRGIRDGINSLLSAGGNPKLDIFTYPDDMNRPRAFYEALNQLRLDATLVRALTSVREYENMIVQSISPYSDKSTGGGMSFVIELSHISVVKTAVVAAPVPVETRAFKKKDQGSKATKAATGDDAERKQSLAFQLFG